MRVEVGDGERVGDERARARAAARPDRDALRLRPLDEVGDDEEVTGIFHACDHVELEGQPLAVVLDRAAGRDTMAVDPAFEPGLGALAQLRRLVDRRALAADREARQDRRLHARPEGAALRDLDRRGDRLGQVGEQLGHFRAGLEAVLGRELAPVGLDHEPPFGDADQRIMSLVIFPAREQRFVGWQRAGCRAHRRARPAPAPRCVPRSCRAAAARRRAGRRRAAASASQRPFASWSWPPSERGVERPAGASGQARSSPSLSPSSQASLRCGCSFGGGFEKRARVEAHQAAVAALARGQENDARALRHRTCAAPCTAVLIGEIERERAADDRLDAAPPPSCRRIRAPRTCCRCR